MNIQFPKAKYRKAFVISGLIVAAQLVGAEAAFAQSAFAPLQSSMQMIVDFINGSFGRLAAIIAVMALGLMAFAGRLSWITAGAVILGMGLVFGAPTIVDQLVAGVK
ncbi:TrbC/VirB2 family protein [Rhizobium sp. RM]|uniref:TrbC/VirB2 family protein n=1 Tax=Rhizobium sp. RM TaxID=2748079 RepID=UPI00110E2DB4|nr:TrbC/VirB2 family protein [Rhizobium sp. RM]NWJ25387.1 TrbC/VirB2 family protein [Rhizobium sp. RM]TMV17531.1 TrbC/VirB2 family protein [Rhizobium sp. Td3]